MSEAGPIFIVVHPHLKDADVARAVAQAMHLMHVDAMNAMAPEGEQEFVPVFADGTENLRAIVTEAVIRRDWVAVAAGAEEEPRCAIIGPTTGAGELLLVAEGATSRETDHG